jgi:hypothetical protein
MNVAALLESGTDATTDTATGVTEGSVETNEVDKRHLEATCASIITDQLTKSSRQSSGEDTANTAVTFKKNRRETPARRQAHVQSEQKRRRTINAGFDALRLILPPHLVPRNEATSKSALLQSGTCTLRFLLSDSN